VTGNQLVLVVVGSAWVLWMPWIWTRRAEWWEGGRPINRLTMMNMSFRVPLAFMPGMSVGFGLLLICARLRLATGIEAFNWAGIIFAVALTASLLLFRWPAFLIPPGYRRAFAKRQARSDRRET